MIKGMKRIFCAVLNLIPLFALASTPTEPHTVPASDSMARVPSVICVVPITHEDVQYLQLRTPRAGAKETCYALETHHHRERGFIALITDRGLLIGWKENTGVPECGYWTAIDDLKQKLLDTFGLIRIRYAGWHIEQCDAP